MSVLQVNQIDFIGLDEISNAVVLTISDHLPWDENESHLLLLQEKLNCYIAFCESGEILESYPQSKGRDLIIEIISEHPLNQMGRNFLDKVRLIIEGAGIGLRYRHFTP